MSTEQARKRSKVFGCHFFNSFEGIMVQKSFKSIQNGFNRGHKPPGGKQWAQLGTKL